MDKTYYIVRNIETGATLKPYGSGMSSTIAPKLYLSYGQASRYRDQFNRHGRTYEVVAVNIEEVEVC